MHDLQNEKSQPSWLRALGGDELPAVVELEGRPYRLARIFKHDFFAATGLYEGSAGQVVLKIGRTARLCGIPLSWIGRYLSGRERRLLTRAGGIAGVPAAMSGIGATSLAHDFVPGRPLRKGDRPDDAFFPALLSLIEAMHARGMAYVDLEKRENILIGEDGRPYLFDFQISYGLSRIGRWFPPERWLLHILQMCDQYHIFKHWRRHRPDQLSEGQWQQAMRPPFWIRWHRRIFRPLTLLRRHILVWLGGRDTASGRSPG